MRLLKFQPAYDDPGEIVGPNLVLRLPQLGDFDQWVSLREASRGFLQPWEPIWNTADHKRSSFRQRLKRYQAELKSGKAVSFYIFVDEGAVLAGGLTLANIKRGVSQSCTLGYWMGKEHAGQGIMKQAVGLIVPYVFDRLKLHRLEAAAIATNRPSINLLEKCGFSFEGKVRKYLKINGKWQDHHLYSLLTEDPRP